MFALGGRLAGAGGALAAQGGHAGSFFTGALAVLVATPAPPLHGRRGRRRPGHAGGGDPGGLRRARPRAGGALCAAGGLPRAGLAATAAGPLDGGAAPGPRLPDVRRRRLARLGAGAAGGAGRAAAGARRRGAGRLRRLGLWPRPAQRRRRPPGRAGARRPRRACRAGAAAGPGAGPAAGPAAAGEAEAWSPARVAALQAEGRPVFVNLTAAWCITCKVNEQLVLRTDPVQAAFAGRNLAYLKGDWTQGMPASAPCCASTAGRGAAVPGLSRRRRRPGGAAAGADRRDRAARRGRRGLSRRARSLPDHHHLVSQPTLQRHGTEAIRLPAWKQSHAPRSTPSVPAGCDGASRCASSTACPAAGSSMSSRTARWAAASGPSAGS
ncbi:thioredoxin family protein [Paeniroseomonas aquatica]|uniref:thioredoxin family protein n=1 Tax=Paeniroseomonas aquatica TaxID=373043 RepID=UPI00361C2A73